jgi:peptidoglycan L-alanyl-D-glutamate endopeptidase CwlK
MIINPASEKKLKGVHPDLIKVVRRAAELHTDPDVGFVITCGVRTIEEQRVLFAKRATRTMNSRHIPGKDGMSKAVDFAVTLNGQVKWDWPLYAKLAKIVKQAAKDVKVPIEWGGDWTSFKDGPHFQLPHAQYP